MCKAKRLIRAIAVLLAVLATLSCSESDVPVITVSVYGLTSDIVSTIVVTTLNGQPSRNQLDPLVQGLDRVELRLQKDTVGVLGIAISAQGMDGCTMLAAQTQVEVTGPGDYSTDVNLVAKDGCQLVVRKIGDGSGTVSLSDGTEWTFDPPEPPSVMCPIESLVASTQQKRFALGTTVDIRALITTESAPGSYISSVKGCEEGTDGCRVTIGADDRVVEISLARNLVCSPEQVCWEHPRPQGASLQRILGKSSNDIWAVGDGAILHWEGTYWAAPRRPQLLNRLSGLVSGPSNSVVAVGDDGVVLRLSSNVWDCPETIGSVQLHDAWGLSPSDFWVVGTQGALRHWDGQSWQSVTVPGLGGVDLWRVLGLSTKNIWAVGTMGTVLHFDGTTWSKVSYPNTETLYGLWLSPEGDVWVVGDRGESALIKDGKVTRFSTGTTNRLRDIFSRTDLEKWAVGDAGTILRHDGKTWSVVESGTRQDLTSIWGSISTDLWAVGTGGTFLRYNGVFWIGSTATRSTRTLYGVGGVASAQSGSTLFAVGEQGTVLRYSGADWVSDSVLGGVIARTFRAITAPSTSEVWIVGDSGTIG